MNAAYLYMTMPWWFPPAFIAGSVIGGLAGAWFGIIVFTRRK